MSSIMLLVVGLTAFVTGYLFYSRYLAAHIYRLDPNFRTPAHEFEDGVDYLPTNKHVLFGHHFGALWISNRHKGQSIGTLTEGIIGERARTLFLLIIFFLVLMVTAVFAVVIANLFIATPGAILPIWAEIPLAIGVGFLVYRTRTGILIPSLVALAIMYALIWVGQYWQPQMFDLFQFSPTAAQLEAAGGDLAAAQAAAARDGVRATWVVILLVYAVIASVLPVWVLLQPRDFINSHQLFLALGVIFLGVLIARPEVVAPAINPIAEPSWFPLLFITIACGAISGFHGLVASGTTSKQLDKETDARFVGYGGAIGEGSLALCSIIACTAGFAMLVGRDAWQQHYSTFASASAGGTQAFVQGVGWIAESALRIPHDVAVIFAAVVVISFAATTMDSAMRIMRYILQELGSQYRVSALQNGVVATLVGAALVGGLALGVDRGAGGMRIWPLFGTTNQLTGGLTLLVVTTFLVMLGRRAWFTVLPMAFLLFMTTWAMVTQLGRYFGNEQWLLFGLGAAVFALEVWLILEAVAVYRRMRTTRRPPPGVHEPELVRYEQGVPDRPRP